MKTLISTIIAVSLGLSIAGCGESSSDDDHMHDGDEHMHEDDGHMHDDGTTHADHVDDHAEGGIEDHAHDETPLGSAHVGNMMVELAQGHGAVAAGKESHLVVKLPYDDNGGSIVRAWIGTEDRSMSMVGKGEYDPSQNHYDVHATAPDPLPENAMWWIEVEKPDGTKAGGSAKPIME